MVNLSIVGGGLLLVSTALGQAHSPPHYPSPRTSGSGDWKAAYAKAREFVGQLTLLEKVNLTTGTGWQGDNCVGNVGTIPRLGFPALCLQDSPLGVRFTTYVSAFPAGMNAAMTWDKKLMYARGHAMGMEFKGKGINVALGPVAGPLGRHPEGGRNWEGFSADPVLTGYGMFETIKGIQDAGVVATAKHYIGNEQEVLRQALEAQAFGHNISEAISSNIDDRTMHELYLWPFAESVRAGVGAVMCSYQQVNNSYGCANSKLLNGLLKDELDFQGFIMSDWAAQHNGVATSLAGLDMSMPGDSFFGNGLSYWGGNLTLAVVNGSVPIWRLDDMVTRIMSAYFYVGQDVKTYPKTNFNSWTTDEIGYAHFAARKGYGLVNHDVDVRDDHDKLIREIGAKSAVLLKNVKGVLPLTGKEKQVAVFGSDAADSPYGPNGFSDRAGDMGTLAMGWGSGTTYFPYLVTPLEAIKARALKGRSLVQSVTDDYAYDQIKAVATQASVCLTFVNADSGEGYINIDGNQGDRKNLTLWHDGEQLINTVASNCNNTIVVIHGVGVVLLEAFIKHPNVTAVLFAGLPGQESGNSLVDVLYGDVNPSGKLPFTIAKKASDYGVHINNATNIEVPQEDFSEGLFIDYRHFDKKGIKPRYEFGYGLSYTTFTYSQLVITKLAEPNGYCPSTGFTPSLPTPPTPTFNPSDYLPPTDFPSWKIQNFIYPYLNNTGQIKKGTYPAPPGAYDVSPQPIPPAGGAPGGNPSLYEPVYEVSVMITNTGPYAGEEVVQLYLETGLKDDPVVVLRGFEKVELVMGQSTVVRILLSRKDLMRWDVGRQDWVVTEGTKKVRVGASSRDVKLTGTLM
ncbi:hypothetical protein K440DRAFT_578757 [Wilcoxina mikolae CBS 423.85]|nr:hypothetical protein K440DRAFT_578757 [Wilcoxina mikolae CBS 423.85]